MGYTHNYAYLPDRPAFRKAWPQMVADARRIIDHAASEYGVGIGPGVLGDPEHPGPQTSVDGLGIWLNGAPPALASETLWIPPPGEHTRDRLLDQNGWFAVVDYVWMFCKTARLPYDSVVCAILLRCHVLAPTMFVVGSDGGWGREWAHGADPRELSPRVLYSDLFPGDEPGTDPLVADPTQGPPAALKHPEPDDD